MRFLEKSLIIGLATLAASCTTDILVERAIKLKENYGGKNNTAGYYFRDDDNGCVLMYRRDHDDWSSFFKILEIELGSERMEKLRKEKPHENGFSLYPRNEMLKVCHLIDKNPINGNADGVAVPEETKAMLDYARYKRTL